MACSTGTGQDVGVTVQVKSAMMLLVVCAMIMLEMIPVCIVESHVMVQLMVHHFDESGLKYTERQVHLN